MFHIETVTLAMLNSRLSRVLTASTRRKHAINLRACLGLPVPCPKAAQKVYALPPLPVLHNALDTSSYRLWGLAMLYGGLRLGEACANQPISGTVLTVDRQRKADGTLASAKTCGPVVLPDWLADEYRAHDFERAPNTVYVGITPRRSSCRSRDCDHTCCATPSPPTSWPLARHPRSCADRCAITTSPSASGTTSRRPRRRSPNGRPGMSCCGLRIRKRTVDLTISRSCKSAY